MAISIRHSVFLAVAICAGVASPLMAAPKMSAGANAAELPEAAKRTVQYLADVHPILAEHCLSCHGAEKQKGGLRLDSREAALAGGSSYGPAIVPGKSEESPLVLFVAHLEEGMEMPPEKEMLPERTVALLRAWIDQGAKWPAQSHANGAAATVSLGNQELIFKKAATHWAFRPVPRADVATLANGPATIDGFVAARLRSAGLKRSSTADPRTLLKRLHFDLTGLPPGAEETERFVADYRQDAQAALTAKVDELLASPHFGERWGRYWLDLARYADTQDFFPQPDLRYPFAWTYRDYVVEAFNADKPYDQFIREQIAADQLGYEGDDPRLAALGFLTVGPRFLRRTDEIINDRIDVVTRGLMGLTVACARCHDHKYDPIPTADFYALHGVFNSTEDLVNLPEIALNNVKVDGKARSEYEIAKTQAQQALADFLQQVKDKAAADVLAKPALYFDALAQIEVKKTADARKLIGGGKMQEVSLLLLSRQWTVSKKPGKWSDDAVVGPLVRVAGTSPRRVPEVLAEIAKTGTLPDKKLAVHSQVLAALRADKPTDESALLKMYGKLLAQAIDTSDPELKQIAVAFSRTEGWLDFASEDVENAYRVQSSGRKELDKLQTVISNLEATHAGAPARAMAVKDKAKPVTPAIFVRGDATRKGDLVTRRFLQVLDPKMTPFPADRSGRRELAERIASPDNPLTPRVWANHVWRHLLGRPLVKTPGDFGLQAEPPSHPELLDWLASALLQRHGSTKKLVRDIVLSATYQQASAERADAYRVDADNALLWRANRRRMDFEAMRDAILATSGQLEPALGGRSVNLASEPFSGRRTIYGFVDRVNLDPLFTTFDFPSPDIASPERSQTLVPQQALFALNDDFIISQARALARLAQDKSVRESDSTSAIDWLYRRVYQRHPTEAEASLARRFLQETATLRNEDHSAPWQYGVGSADPSVPRNEAFQPLTYFDPQAKRYQGGRVFPHPKHSFASLGAAGGHPGAGMGRACIRRWIAPCDGEFAIDGELSVGRQNKGDGVRARAIASGLGLLGEWIADRTIAKTELKNVKIKAGEIVDFAVDCRDTTTSDGFRWAPTIKLLVRPEDAPTNVQTVWDAQADFQAPPPPKLEPLEQVAHALLMTNEFLFVD
jgi:hypothetical protein